MTLYDLLNNIEIQGYLIVKDFTGELDGKVVYRNYDDINHYTSNFNDEDLDKEVAYIYSDKHYTIDGTEAHTVIEIQGEE